ncbi:Tim44/TimA family putative adaptor protein [Kordiimonas sp.]|uniref:Tim44/TimA family putative adaptor protein n=1 Tax=Kordiimonas sp. TaxID=1970157 RepID=UPI003A92CA37
MLDIILLAMLAAFILLRLRSELGKKTGNEPLPPAAPRPGRDGAKPVVEADFEDVSARDDTVIDMEENSALRKGYQDIRRADSSFDVPTFVGGARSAYEMILEAFWSGDKETLRTFLDDSVYNQFTAAIEAREQNGYQLDNRLVDIAEADIVEAKLEGKTAELIVRFKAEIIAVTKDGEGNLVEGNLSEAVEVNDRWTFARDTRSRDPNWLLVATRAG